MKKVLLFALAIFANTLEGRETVPLNLRQNDQKETILSFGSCYGIFNRFGGDIFKMVNQNDPSLFIWLGDAAYTDNVHKAGLSKDNSMSIDYVKERFQRTLDDPYYIKMKERTQVIGMWDDHDYGCNNGDKYFSKKDIMRDIFLDFIDEPKDSQHYTILHDDLKIHVILIDVRWDFDEKTFDRFGQEQLAWLDKTFSAHQDSALTIIGFGVQVLPDRFFITEAMNWRAKNELFTLIRKYKKSGVFLLSGDVHFAQFYHTNCQSLTGYNLQEVTSSGMTHHVNSFFKIADRILNYVTPLFWNSSEVLTDFNFAVMKVKRERNDVKFTVQTALEKVLSLKNDMTFDEKLLRYSKMCEATHAKNKKVLQANHYLYEIIKHRPKVLYLVIAALFSLKSLLLTLFVKGIVLFTKCCGFQNKQKLKRE